MLSFIYPISYLFCLTWLILWFYFRENALASRKMSALFLISFLIYLFSLAFSDGSLSYKLLILFRDLLILAVLSQLFSYVRKNRLLVFFAAVVIYGLIQFIGFNMLFQTFPEDRQAVVPADDEFELLVETKDGKIPDAYDELIRKYNLIVRQAFQPADPSLTELDDFIVIGIPEEFENKQKEIVRELRRIEGTEHVETNEVIQLELLTGSSSVPQVQSSHVNDPLIAQQWGWDLVQGDQVHEIIDRLKVIPRKKTLIAIIDSGVDASHPDLQNQFKTTGQDNDVDPLGHGTHCAGIAAAVSNNGIGIASLVPGVDFVNVMSVRVMNSMGIGTQLATIRGMVKAADLGADVISMSLGGISNDNKQRAYEEAVRYANAKGAIVVAAAGNGNQNAKNYAPANANGVITVSALNADMSKAPFSNTIGDLKYGVAAPGVKIVSTYPGGQYKELNGTSMATPMVSGLIALLKSFQPALTTEEAFEILDETGKNMSDEKDTGRLIQAANALEKVLD